MLGTVGNQCAGVIALSDAVRGEAKAAVQKLREMQTTAVLLTGDHAEAIRATFRYALLWLRAARRDAQEMPGYDAAYLLWQEAAFSDHAMTLDQREQVLAFQQTVSDTIQTDAGRLQKWKLRYQYAL